MTNATKLIAGLLFIAVTTIEYGGTFLLDILSGKYSGFTDFQRSMFRAGHGHAVYRGHRIASIDSNSSCTVRCSTYSQAP